jgi:hypothetical protein
VADVKQGAPKKDLNWKAEDMGVEISIEQYEKIIDMI